MTVTMVQVFQSQEDEISAASSWISARITDGVAPGEIGVRYFLSSGWYGRLGSVFSTHSFFNSNSGPSS